MAKNCNTKSRALVSCFCPVCGQKSNAREGTTHFGCIGVPGEFFAKFPKMKGRFSRPNAKGTWQAV